MEPEAQEAVRSSFSHFADAVCAGELKMTLHSRNEVLRDDDGRPYVTGKKVVAVILATEDVPLEEIQLVQNGEPMFVIPRGEPGPGDSRILESWTKD